MNYQEEAKLAKEFFDSCHSTLTKKANDYAKDSNPFSNFEGIASIVGVPIEKVFLMFLTVKILRLVELSTKDAQVNESKEDTLMDLANYSALYAIYMKGQTDVSR